MDDMPRPRPPHLHRQVTRRGEVVWYVRIGHGPRTRIRAASARGSSRLNIKRRSPINTAPKKPDQ